MSPKKSSHVGRKILYSLVIALSGLIALLCVAGIIGGWALESRAEKAAITALKFVDNSAAVVRKAIARVDQPLATLETKTSEIAAAAQEVSQDVSDQGLVRTLLPEEKDQQLMAAADSLRDTFTEVHDTIGSGLSLYRTIDSIPFINLPSMSATQMDKIDGGVSQAQALVATVKSQIADARSGAAGAIDKVTATVALLSGATGQVRDRLANTDAKLAALQALAVHLQQVVPTALVILAVVISLLLAFVIFTQVEVILLYVRRWRLLGQAAEAPVAEVPAPPAPPQS